MDKAAILTDLLSNDFVGELVGELKLAETLTAYDAEGKSVPTNIKMYVQRYLEVVGKAARTKEARIYVVDDGVKDKETAYYVDNAPSRSIPIWGTDTTEEVIEGV